MTELDEFPRTGLPNLDAFLAAGRQRRRAPQPEPAAALSLWDDQGEWLISSYGEHVALGFKGSLDFIRRCYYWAINSGVIHKGQQLNWYYEAITGRLAYVCPKNREAILAGLTEQFRGEIIWKKEVPPLRKEWVEDTLELEYNEAEIDRRAAQQAAQFMQERIVPDNFVLSRLTGVGEVYSVGAPGREWNTDWS